RRVTARGGRRRFSARDARDGPLILELRARARALPTGDDTPDPPAGRGTARGGPDRLRSDLRRARLRAARLRRDSSAAPIDANMAMWPTSLCPDSRTRTL